MYQDDQRKRIRIIIAAFIGFLLVGGIAIGIISAVIKSNDDSGVTRDISSDEDVYSEGGGEEEDPNKKTVELNESIVNLYVGGSAELLVSVRPVDIDDTIAWESEDTQIVTVDSEGKITAIAPGTTEVTVTVNREYTASCTVNVIGESPQGGDGDETIMPEKVFLSDDERTIYVGESFVAKATIQPSNATDKTVTWESDDTDVATVDNSGKITGKKAGETTITATTHNGKTGSLTVKVKAQSQTFIPVSSIKINQSSAKVKTGAKIKLSATVSPSNATDKTITWSSANTGIAIVGGDGTVTGKKAGTAKIVATSVNGKTASINVVVENAAVEPTGVKVEPSSATLYVGATVTLKATIAPSIATNKTLTWSSGNTAVATVNNNGVVTAKKAGTAKIAVSTHNGKTAIATITVKSVEPTSVTISPSTATVVVGNSTKLSATVLPANAANKNVTWSSSNTAIATVSTDGTVTGKSAGTITITARTANGKSASATITVKIAVTGVTMSLASATMNVGSTRTLTATVSPSNATDRALTWSSSDATIATVSSAGLVTAKKAGKAVITAKTSNGKYATCTITVKEVAVTKVTLNKTSATMTVGQKITLTATITPSNATNKTVTWGSSRTAVAIVNSNGVVTAKKAGTSTITVTTANGKTASCAITVKEVAVTGVTLNKTSATITVGKTITLTATIAPSNATDKTVTWGSSRTAVAIVNSKGVVTAKKAGTSTITVTTANGKTASCAITVKAATTSSVNGLDDMDSELSTLGSSRLEVRSRLRQKVQSVIETIRQYFVPTL